ncbi:MAG: hypothetical protein R3321_03020, partial [Nitrososphaeraceae archaeon]|nr:hypothetical protein [Nitrososphaeraceae archaeon]
AASGDIEIMRLQWDGSVGIGTSNPDGTLHVQSGSAGTVTADASADELVIEGSANTGISILAPDNSFSSIYLGAPGDNNAGRFQWKDTTRVFRIGTQLSMAEVQFEAGSGQDVFVCTDDRFMFETKLNFQQLSSTIAEGVMTSDNSFLLVNAETGTTDDLDTLSGGSTGDVVILKAASGDTITVKNGTGNIVCPSDRTLTGDDTIMLIYDGTNWCEVSYTDN